MQGSNGVNGVVYFNATFVRQFSLNLAACLFASSTEIDWKGLVRRKLEATTRDPRGPVLADEPLATWLMLAPALIAAAHDFHIRNGRPMTLVIDSTHDIARECPAFLDQLQDFAKTAADTGNLRIVFISSDETALERMKGRSAWSRAETPVEVGDISDVSAISFVLRRHKVDNDFATELVQEVNGGRFSLLVNPIPRGKLVCEIRREMDIMVDKKLKRLKLTPMDPFFQKLTANGSVDANEALSLLGCDRSTVSALLAADIIAAHNNGTYTAHSRFIKTFLKRAQLYCQPVAQDLNSRNR